MIVRYLTQAACLLGQPLPQSLLMNKGAIYTIQSKAADFPELLREIPTAPDQIYVRGSIEAAKQQCVAIVGSRKVSPYGRAITYRLAEELSRAGVVIVSGLAMGVDAIAHRAALEAGGVTIAVLAGGLDTIYPGTHAGLARQIQEQGGALISEYPSGVPSYKQNFIARNRIVSGLSQAVLITEAAEKSGSLHTAQFALEQGRDVLVVPGNITSPTSKGTNSLLRVGATPVTSSSDILQLLDIESPRQKQVPQGSTPEEQSILNLIAAGETDGTILQLKSRLDIVLYNQTITMLEITGKIRSMGANHWSL